MVRLLPRRSSANQNGADHPGAPPLAIQAINLTKHYGRTTALAQLSLRIAPGEIFGLIGPNGAGKTTTLTILAGLQQPDHGQILINGQPLTSRNRAVRRQLGYMPEDFGLYDNLRVWEYLDFFASCYEIPARERPGVIVDLLELVDLTEKRDEMVANLSRGMRQRLCLAHALVHDPAILILDEPASGLDPRARVELREILRTLASLSKTVVISSHILSELAEICTRLAILDRGHLIASGTIEEIASLAHARPVEVRLIAGSDLDVARNLIKASPGVRTVEVQPSRQELVVDLDGDESDQAGLLQRLIQNGLPVISFSQRTGSLEELFLALTERQPQPEEVVNR